MALGNAVQIEQANLNLGRNREREAFAMVAKGHTNKALARQIDITVKTIEARRSRIMEKPGVTTLAEIVEIFQTAEKC